MKTSLALLLLVEVLLPWALGQEAASSKAADSLEKATALPSFGWALEEDAFRCTEDGWLGVRLEDGTAIVRHLPTGRQIQSPAEVQVRVLRFRPEHREVWLGTEAKGILVASLQGTEDQRTEFTTLDYSLNNPVGELEFASTGQAFAWSYLEGKTVTVVSSIGVLNELRVQDRWFESARFEDLVHFPFSGSSLPPFQFARRGRTFIFAQKAGNESATKAKGEGIGRVYDLQTQKLVTRFRPYVKRESRGWALSPDEESLLFARRDAMSDWSIQRLALTEPGGLAVLDADARGRHFVDLFCDGSGRWLVESDHEEEGVRVYDLRGKEKPLLLGSRDFVGFIETESDPLIVTRTEEGTGHCAWGVNGEIAVERIPDLPNRGYSRVERFGDYVAWAGWSSPEDSIRIDYHIDVLQLP